MLSPLASPLLVPVPPENGDIMLTKLVTKMVTEYGDKRVSLTFIQNEMNETHTHIKDGLNLVIGLVFTFE